MGCGCNSNKAPMRVTRVENKVPTERRFTQTRVEQVRQPESTDKRPMHNYYRVPPVTRN